MTVRGDIAVFRRLLRLARPCRGQLLALFLVSLLSTPLALLVPVPLKLAVDNAIGEQPLPAWVDSLLPGMLTGTPGGVLALAVLLMVTVELLNQLQGLVVAFMSTAVAQRLVLDFRTMMFRHLQRLSLAYHDRTGSADTTYRMAWDAQAIQYVPIHGAIPFATAGLWLVGMVIVIARLDWQLAVVALAISPALGLLAERNRSRLREGYREAEDLESRSLAVVDEVIGALRVVKAFGREEHEVRRFSERAVKGVEAHKTLAFAEGWLGLQIGLVTSVGTAATLMIGVGHVRSGAMTLGELLLVMAYLAQLYGPLATLSRTIASIQTHLASADRAFALLDEAPEVPERPGAMPIARAQGAVSFENVSFGYVESRTVLHDVSFNVSPGQIVGISGTTGAGKTTLMSLLTRFYDPTEGRIQLDGADLRDYRLADLRNQFAIVLQEPVLFAGTLRDNIAYGRPEATEAEIIEAAKAANVHDAILSLSDGYDTPVGERGSTLSGGERQRISLARAFLKDAPILILDEPTSSVDVGTEALIMDAMHRLMASRTTFIIAHRLSTLERCDVRLILEEGRLVSASTSSGTPGRDATATLLGAV